MGILKQSHSATKSKRGCFGLFNDPICCKLSKNLTGGPFGDIKKIQKNLTVPKKSNGDP